MKVWLNKHYPTVIILVSLFIFLIFLTHLGIKENAEWNAIPIVNREVFSNVVVSDYTECVFVMDDGFRYITDENPCRYKAGEVVKTKLTKSGEVVIIE